MPATITIPPHYWASVTLIEFVLTDSRGHLYPAELGDASGFVSGRNVIRVDENGAVFTLPTNDEIPSAPGDDPNPSVWQITVQESRHVGVFRVSISSANPPGNWNELIQAGTPVDPADIWSGLLLPGDAVSGEYVRKATGPGWEAVPPPAGTGDVSGPAGGVADGDMAVFDGPTGKIIRGGGPPESGGGIPEPADDGVPKLRRTLSAVSSWVDGGSPDDPAQQNLETHKNAGDHDARYDARYDPSGAAQSVADDLSSHKASGDHDARYDAAGTAAGAVAGHESTYQHSRIPTAAQNDALDAATSLSGADPVAAVSDVSVVSTDLSTHKTSGDHDARYDAAGTAAGAVAGHESTYQHSRIPTADQSDALNANPKLSAGDPVAAISDVSGPSTDELVKITAADTTAGYLSLKLFSGDASVSFTVVDAGANERIDVRATGAGGGERNTGQNIGGAVEIYPGMNGTQLQLRTFAATPTVSPTLAGDTIEFSVPGGVFDVAGSAAAVDAALTTHIGSGDHDARYAGVAPSDGNTYSQRDGAWVVSPITPIGGVWTQYTWSEDTNPTSPAVGRIKANDEDQASATAIYVHQTTAGGNDAHEIWMAYQPGDYLGIWEDRSDREGIYYAVTGPPQNNTGWYTIPVTAVPGWAGGIDDGQAVAAFLARDPRNRNPVGGAQFDVLRKASAADHATQWHALVPADIGAEPEITPKRAAFNTDFGGLPGTTCEGNDSRLSDARTPTPHAASHMGGADPITSAGIGAVPNTRVIAAGVGIVVSPADGILDEDLTIALGNTAVTPRAYVNANITVDAQGRITAADDGIAGGGIGAGSPFVVGDLLAVESDTGEGLVQSVGFAPSDVARLSQAADFAATVTGQTGVFDGANRVYSLGNPPPYPVTSVAGLDSIIVVPITGATVVSLLNDQANPGNSKYYGTSAAGLKGYHDLPPGGGWQDGTTIADWGQAGQPVAATGNETFDLDNGHHFYTPAPMAADKTINFQTTAGHNYTDWDALIDIGAFTPTFQFNGGAIREADGYSISAGGLYWFTFKRSGTDYVVSERRIP